MEFAFAYTLGAIAVYFIASWVLNYIEEQRGQRFAQRNVIFFIIIFVLALILVNLINPVPETLPDQPAP